MIAVRSARQGDAPMLADIHAAALPPGWGERAFLPYLREPGSICLLAAESGLGIGLAVVRIAGDEAEILTLGVRPGHARQGAGKELMRAALDWASSMGARVVYLEVAEGNKPARSLYGGFGFTLIARREHYYQINRHNPEAALILRLDLAAHSQRAQIMAGADGIP
jgi:ribosomal-protein-alanine N-acetyltransferase